MWAAGCGRGAGACIMPWPLPGPTESLHVEGSRAILSECNDSVQSLSHHGMNLAASLAASAVVSGAGDQDAV
jgi:hypothetical protein